MPTTETKIGEAEGTVSQYEATETWSFYRCEECNAAASSPDEIVHELHCSQCDIDE